MDPNDPREVEAKIRRDDNEFDDTCIFEHYEEDGDYFMASDD